MTNASSEKQTIDAQAEKARMLITILGNDFTRNSSHPFFKSLNETAAQPAVPAKGQPDISRALKNLMAHLSSQKAGSSIATSLPKAGPERAAQESALSTNQHPALIASSLAKMAAPERRVHLKSLSGPLACRVLVYLREIETRTA